MAKRERKFNVMMSSEDFSKLTWLSNIKGVSRGLIIRQCISAMWIVVHDHESICADGHQCLCRGLRVFTDHPQDITQTEIEEKRDGNEAPAWIV